MDNPTNAMSIKCRSVSVKARIPAKQAHDNEPDNTDDPATGVTMEPGDGLPNILDELLAFRDQNPEMDMDNPTNAMSVECRSVSIKAKIPATKASSSMKPDEGMHVNRSKYETSPPGKTSGDSTYSERGTVYFDHFRSL